MWIDVKERLPEKSGEYFVYCDPRPVFFPYCGVNVANYNNPNDYTGYNPGWVYYGNSAQAIAPTHWAEIDPPGGE